MNWKEACLLLCLIWLAISKRGAAANRIQHRRYLVQEAHKSNPKQVKENTSPSPGPEKPAAKTKPGTGNDKVDASPPEVDDVPKETCDPKFNKCQNDAQNITACLLQTPGDGGYFIPFPFEGPFLLVHNEGQSSFTFNVTILPSNSTTLDIGVTLAHQVSKINVSSNATMTTAVVLNAHEWTCRIGRRNRLSLNFPSYIAKIKPITGVYLISGTILIIGVLWAGCKQGKDVKHLNGVPYQGLEMGRQESGAYMNVETVDSWDQSWEDWDDEMAVESPGGSHVDNGQGQANGNGSSSKSADISEWSSDWNE
ncbi:OLC1v1026981C1 [Oldenlandia corymbosa var. corymbosa]|uniref:OLC1v1026981C1 n=1 Tax=Oldenlandia corymbosa var. corymbosa TaxID=529605 RepID=A0AAV1CBN1_OLDCO|nr:OLC1v1026981C1 [Oldenlandia corymbosa var. corymbosa]